MRCYRPKKAILSAALIDLSHALRTFFRPKQQNNIVSLPSNSSILQDLNKLFTTQKLAPTPSLSPSPASRHPQQPNPITNTQPIFVPKTPNHRTPSVSKPPATQVPFTLPQTKASSVHASRVPPTPVPKAPSTPVPRVPPTPDPRVPPSPVTRVIQPPHKSTPPSPTPTTPLPNKLLPTNSCHNPPHLCQKTITPTPASSKQMWPQHQNASSLPKRRLKPGHRKT